MWSICRVDTHPITNKPMYFEVHAAYRKRDLDTLEEVRKKSGFVGPDDKLVIIGPDGKIR
jgi:hypothetical protein